MKNQLLVEFLVKNEGIDRKAAEAVARSAAADLARSGHGFKQKNRGGVSFWTSPLYGPSRQLTVKA